MSGPEALAARSHIERCTDCTREAQELEILARQLSATGVAPDAMSIRRLRNTVLARADAALRSQHRPQRRGSGVALAVAAVAVLATTTWALRRAKHGNELPNDFAAVSAEGARFTRTARSGLELIDLADGALSISTHMKPPGQRLVVRVPDGEIEDIGTIFRITVRDGGTREIAVSEGSVVFRRPSAPDLRLSSGAVWSPAPAPTTERAVENAVPFAALSEPQGAQAPARQQQNSALARADKRKTETTSGKVSAPLPSEDESYLRILALLREHRDEEARVTAEEYLRRFPAGFRRAEVEGLTRRARSSTSDDRSPYP
jgi:hypothetical protein